MKIPIRLLTVSVLLALIAWAIHRGIVQYEARDEPEDHAPDHAAADAGETPAEEPGLHLTPENLETLGITFAPPAVLTLRPSWPAYGQIIDAAPLAAALSEIDAASATLAASAAERTRSAALFKSGGNLSQKALEAAEAAYRTDEIKLAAQQRSAAFAWGTLATTANPALLDHLASDTAALARVTLPAGANPDSFPVSARLATLADPETFLTTSSILRSSAADPKFPGTSWLLILDSLTHAPPPGTPLTAWLETNAPAASGFVIPRSAILRHDRQTWFYGRTKANPTAIIRVPIKIETPVAEGWFVSEPITAEMEIALTGAAALLTAETNSTAGED